MGEDAEEEFPGACRVGAGGERGAEAPLVPGEDALDLPALAVAAAGEAVIEPPTVSALWDGVGVGARVDRDGCEGDPEGLAAEAVVVLPVEGCIGQHSRQGDPSGRLARERWQGRRVVGRPEGDLRGRYEVGVVVTADGQFGPSPSSMRPGHPAAPHEVGADVAGLEARGVDGPVCGLPDQAACAGPGEDDVQEAIECPPFRSRCSA